MSRIDTTVSRFLIAASVLVMFTKIISAQTRATTQPGTVERKKTALLSCPTASSTNSGSSTSRKSCTKKPETRQTVLSFP
jgi:hypothetical protein